MNIKVEETFLGNEPIPCVWQVTEGQDASIDALADWLRENRVRLTKARDQYGAVLLRGFQAINSPPAYSAILDVIAPNLMDYVGGSAPRHVVYGRITTASELPENWSLALHQEMAYQRTRPDALTLFCETPANEGGETPIADARVVTQRIDPGVRARFDRYGIQVRRALPYRQAEGRIPRPWPAVLGTNNREEANRIAKEMNWTIDWEADDSMFLWQEVLPPFQTHPRTGERVWANQVHYHTPECWLRWALRDRREEDAAKLRKQMKETPEQLDQVFLGDGTRVSGEDTEHIWDVLERSEIPVRWQRCDVLLLDNILAMHGRRAFRGPRSILVGLIRERSLPE
jgi:hypothetical protein